MAEMYNANCGRRKLISEVILFMSILPTHICLQYVKHARLSVMDCDFLSKNHQKKYKFQFQSKNDSQIKKIYLQTILLQMQFTLF